MLGYMCPTSTVDVIGRGVSHGAARQTIRKARRIITVGEDEGLALVEAASNNVFGVFDGEPTVHVPR